jgi:hypothetical protein
MGTKANTAMVTEPMRWHTLHTTPMALFTLFQWCTGRSTPAICQAGLGPAYHCWCKSRAGVWTPVHVIFPKRRTGVGKKREVIYRQIHAPHSIFLMQTFLVSSLRARALSSVLIPASTCSDGVRPLILSPSNAQKPQEVEEVDWLASSRI